MIRKRAIHWRRITIAACAAMALLALSESIAAAPSTSAPAAIGPAAPGASATAAPAATVPAAATSRDAPSRPALKGCRWEKLSDATIGLAAWVQRCDFGFRKIDFSFVDHSLAIHYSDGGAAEPLVDVIPLQTGEAPEAAVARVFAAHSDAGLVAHCLLRPYREVKPPAGTKLYTFVPNAAYAKELKAKSDPNEVPDPPCGDWGDGPDGIRYFQVWPAGKAAAILFVRVGQDKPLFDEKTLRLIGP